eukprot:GHVR01053355.1.p1 GENE.GHVR01053355.1~~GHVR01053355.1.p1  ORF type:complete len:524 (-),score=132.70 GHVR01053355.1:231-1802(-)
MTSNIYSIIGSFLGPSVFYRLVCRSIAASESHETRTLFRQLSTVSLLKYFDFNELIKSHKIDADVFLYWVVYVGGLPCYKYTQSIDLLKIPNTLLNIHESDMDLYKYIWSVAGAAAGDHVTIIDELLLLADTNDNIYKKRIFEVLFCHGAHHGHFDLLPRAARETGSYETIFMFDWDEKISAKLCELDVLGEDEWMSIGLKAAFSAHAGRVLDAIQLLRSSLHNLPIFCSNLKIVLDMCRHRGTIDACIDICNFVDALPWNICSPATHALLVKKLVEALVYTLIRCKYTGPDLVARVERILNTVSVKKSKFGLALAVPMALSMGRMDVAVSLTQSLASREALRSDDLKLMLTEAVSCRAWDILLPLFNITGYALSSSWLNYTKHTHINNIHINNNNNNIVNNNNNIVNNNNTVRAFGNNTDTHKQIVLSTPVFEQRCTQLHWLRCLRYNERCKYLLKEIGASLSNLGIVVTDPIVCSKLIENAVNELKQQQFPLVVINEAIRIGQKFAQLDTHTHTHTLTCET